MLTIILSILLIASVVLNLILLPKHFNKLNKDISQIPIATQRSLRGAYGLHKHRAIAQIISHISHSFIEYYSY